MHLKTRLQPWLIQCFAIILVLFLAIVLSRKRIADTLHVPDLQLTMRDTSEGPFKGGASGSFKHYNTIAPKEERVFPLLDNRGKTAIVTGAGAGIGLSVAQGLAESGANVAIWYHGNRKAIDRAKEIEETYGVQCETRYHQDYWLIPQLMQRISQVKRTKSM